MFFLIGGVILLNHIFYNRRVISLTIDSKLKTSDSSLSKHKSLAMTLAKYSSLALQPSVPQSVAHLFVRALYVYY
uniref:Uncharacterized protein n=1 Tax=Pararge aegeria TaxID=116150 RepID=S4PXS4_9NEOP